MGCLGEKKSFQISRNSCPRASQPASETHARLFNLWLQSPSPLCTHRPRVWDPVPTSSEPLLQEEKTERANQRDSVLRATKRRKEERVPTPGWRVAWEERRPQEGTLTPLSLHSLYPPHHHKSTPAGGGCWGKMGGGESSWGRLGESSGFHKHGRSTNMARAPCIKGHSWGQQDGGGGKKWHIGLSLC